MGSIAVGLGWKDWPRWVIFSTVLLACRNILKMGEEVLKAVHEKDKGSSR